MKKKSNHNIPMRFIAFLIASMMVFAVPAQFTPFTVSADEPYDLNDPGTFERVIDENSSDNDRLINSGGVYLITGTYTADASAANSIRVQTTDPVTLVLNNADFTTTGSGTHGPLVVGTVSSGTPVIGANVTIILAAGSDNKFESTSTNSLATGQHAGICVNVGSSLTIKSEDPLDNPGSLTAIGGAYSAGIGAGPNQSAGKITIESGIIVAESHKTPITSSLLGQFNGAGIGGGGGVSGGGGTSEGIIINGSAHVTATSYGQGAGIGGAGGGDTPHNGLTGGPGSGGIIEISGNATVIAESKGNGAGIGGGGRVGTGSSSNGADGGNITIYGSPTVVAKGNGTSHDIGAGYKGNVSSHGADAIITITGGNVHPVNGKITTVTNGSLYGGSILSMAWIDSTSITKYLLPLTVPYGTGNSSYSYEANTSPLTDDRAYVWLPAGGPEETAVTVGDGEKIYTSSDNKVTIEVEATHTHNLGSVTKMDWFRVPVSSTAVYDASASDFDNGYAAAASNPANADSESTPSSGTKTFSFADIAADKNAHYWVRVEYDNYDGASYAYYDFVIDNYYTIVNVSVQDEDLSKSEIIKPYEKLGSAAYGLPYDLDDTVLAAVPSLGFDVVSYIHNVFRPLSHWDLTMPALTHSSITSASLSTLITLDGEIARGSPVEDNTAGSNAANRYYTAKYERLTDTAKWCELEIFFVDIDGQPFHVSGGATSATILVPLDHPAMTANNFRKLGGEFTPPTIAGDTHEARGWYISSEQPHKITKETIAEGGTTIAHYYTQNDFTEFNPPLGTISDLGIGNFELDGNRKLYIVYDSPAVRLVENHLIYDDSVTGGKTTDEADDPTNYVVDPSTDTYKKQSLTTIPDMVCVGFEVVLSDATIIIPFSKFDASSLEPDESQLGSVWAEFTNSDLPNDIYTDKPIINFYYEESKGGIPVSEVAFLTTRWRGIVPVGDFELIMTAKSPIVDAPTRINRDITKTNDETIGGDNSHVIDGEATPTLWYFDPDYNSSAHPKLQTVKPTLRDEHVEIIFYYNFSTNGYHPDKDQFVTEKYKLSDGTPIPGESETKQSSFVETQYTKTAPEIPGYVAVGVYQGDYTGSSQTYTAGDTISFHRDQNTPSEIVTFVYKHEAKLNVIHQLTTTGSAADINFREFTVTNYDGKLEEIWADPRADLELIKVELDGVTWSAESSGAYEVTLDAANDKELIFYYKELHTYTTLTINGLKDTSTGDRIYTLSLRFEVEDTVTLKDVTESLLPMLAPEWVMKSGEAEKLTGIDISTNKTINLVYESGNTSVTIYVKLWDGGTNSVDIITPATISKCAIGSPFGYDSPSVEGYQLVDAAAGNNITPYTETIPSVSTTANTITFYYRIATGNQRVVYIDSDTNAVFGSEMVEVINGMQKVIPVPSIANYTEVTTTPATVTWDGSLPIPDVEFYYTRNTATLTLIAKSTLTGDEIKNASDSTITFDVIDRVFENYDYSEDIASLTVLVNAEPDKYNLAAQGSTLYYIQFSGNEATVWYTPVRSGEIPVEVRVINPGASYTESNPATYTLLQTFDEPAAANESISFAAARVPDLTALGYVYSDGDSNLTATEGLGDKIILVYTDNRYVTTIRNNLDSIVITDRTVAGHPITLNPPYKTGAVAIQYSTNGGANKIPIPDGFTGLPVNETTDVIFYYDTFKNITVTGIDSSSNTLYTFTRRVATSNTPYNGLSAADLPVLAPTWVLKSGQAAKLANLNVSVIAPLNIVLEYESGVTDVTVHAYIHGTTTKVIDDSIIIPGVAMGGSFSYTAPSIPGYQLVDSAGANIAGTLTTTIPTVSATDRTIIFYYKAAVGNQIVRYVENGVEFGRTTIPLPVNVETLIPYPDITNYTKLSQQEEKVTWNGTLPIVDIVYEYTRNTAVLTLEAYSTLTNAQIGSISVTSAAQRVLEYYDYSANIPALTALVNAFGDYSLSAQGSTWFYITTNPGSNIVRVWYNPVQSGEIPVEVRMVKNGETYNANDPATYSLMQTFAEHAATNETITFALNRVPDLTALGYLHDIAKSKLTATEGLSGDKIILVYTDIRDAGSLTIVVTDAATGLPLGGADVRISVDGNTATNHTTDFDGRLSFPAAVFGTYRIEVSKNPYTRSVVTAALTANYPNQTVYIAMGTVSSPGTIIIGGGDSSGGSGNVTSAKLIIKCVDAFNSVIFSQSISAVVGATESVNAPPLSGYSLVEKDSKIIQIVAGTNEVVFRYVIASGEPAEKTTITSASAKIMKLLETEDHVTYVQGYPDGTIRPDGSITRAEISTIFWRLLKSPDKNNPISGTFSDMNDSDWYAQSVNYLASLGIIKGYEDGSFKPNQSITRAEFSALVSRFDDLDLGVSNPFSDVSDSHWARDCIVSSYSKGWISGYPGNVFLPQNNITRAEVVKVVNRMLGRGIKKANIPSSAYGMFADLPQSHWAFAEIIEASLPHTYTKLSDGYEVYN